MSSSEQHMCGSIDKFTYIVQGLIKDRWSGKIALTTDSGNKSLNLVNGRFVSTTSELLDDRLGEIFYRYGFMSLDALMQIIKQLTPNRRIGQIALDDNLLNYNQLWFSLQVQIINVVQSVYLGKEVTYEFKPNDGDFGCGLIEPSLELINRLKVFHLSFQRFCAVACDSAIVTVNTTSGNMSQFTQDMLDIVAEHRTVSEIILNSRLHPSYTLLCLMQMFADNQVSIEEQWQPTQLDANLQQTISNYNSIATSVTDALRKHGFTETIDEIITYANDFVIDCKIVRTLSLDSNAMLTPFTMQIISDHCAVDQSQVSRYLVMVNSIAKFVSQLAVDILPASVSGKITVLHQFARSA